MAPETESVCTPLSPSAALDAFRAELKRVLLAIGTDGTREGFLFAKEMFAKHPELRGA
jgi:hypothetical protein